MSAIGTKRTSLVALHMSALGGKADIGCTRQRWLKRSSVLGRLHRTNVALRKATPY